MPGYYSRLPLGAGMVGWAPTSPGPARQTLAQLVAQRQAPSAMSRSPVSAAPPASPGLAPSNQSTWPAIINALRGITGLGGTAFRLGAEPQVPGAPPSAGAQIGGGLGLLSGLLGIGQAIGGQGPANVRALQGLSGGIGAVQGGAGLTGTQLPTGVGAGLGIAGPFLAGLGTGGDPGGASLASAASAPFIASALGASGLVPAAGPLIYGVGSMLASMLTNRGNYIPHRQQAITDVRDFAPEALDRIIMGEDPDTVMAWYNSQGRWSTWAPEHGGFTAYEADLSQLNAQAQAIIRAARAGQIPPEAGVAARTRSQQRKESQAARAAEQVSGPGVGSAQWTPADFAALGAQLSPRALALGVTPAMIEQAFVARQRAATPGPLVDDPSGGGG